MRKYLSIVIPRYRETEVELFPLLSSIRNQLAVDFRDMEILVVNDGSEALNADFLSLFPMEIKQVTLEENRGPGMARQAGMDAASGEYVMFCDADDILFQARALDLMLQEADKTAADILTSSWLEELWTPETGYRYITHEMENTWMHGKLFRRQFLVQNGIRFHDGLRIHEDSYFLGVALPLAERARYMPVVTYVWKYRPDSITRRDNGAYTFTGIATFFQAITMAYGRIEALRPEQMEYKIVQLMLYAYFSLHQPQWQTEKRRDDLRRAEDALRQYLRPFWRYWENAQPETVAAVYNEERGKVSGAFVERETLDQWLARLALDGGEANLDGKN